MTDDDITYLWQHERDLEESVEKLTQERDALRAERDKLRVDCDTMCRLWEFVLAFDGANGPWPSDEEMNAGLDRLAHARAALGDTP